MERLIWTAITGLGLSLMISGSSPSPAVVRTAAEDFLATLSTEQKTKLNKPLTDDYRELWRFVPASRQGLNWADLNENQTAKANALLKAALSQSGYAKVNTIQDLEDVLYVLEGNNRGRDRNLYTFTFFGEPHPTDHWAWRFEGHHISLNFTYKGDQLVASTPQFFGSNPAEVREGEKKGLRALPQEQDLAFRLLNLLTEDQKKTAVMAEKAPRDILTGQDRQAAILEKSGIAYADLTDNQKKALTDLINAHLNAQSPEEQKRRWNRVEPETLTFAWMGSTEPGQGHYYHIQGSKFLIEYDNVQNNANHIHAVWRDFENDFGRDILADHYHEHSHSH